MTPPDLKPVLARADVRKLDEATIAAGTPSLELMERAGHGIADFVESRRRGAATSLLVLAGPGNNGGDGFVVARLLAERGWDVTVALCGPPPKDGGDAAANLARWRDAGGAVTSLDDVVAKLSSGAAPWDVALDALFGTGLERPLTGRPVEVIRALNASGLFTVAVDVPSGLCADTGQPLGAAVLADATVTIGAGKPGLFVGVGPDHAGRVSIADIGLLAPAAAGVEPVGQLIDQETCALWMPPRRRTSHKGDLGHVLVVGGQLGKTGAVLLAARGALRAGAGLVTMCVPESLVAATDAALAEAMTIGMPEARGRVASRAWPALSGDIQRFSTAVVGPGLGTEPGAAELVDAMLREFKGTLVIDADGLNVLAARRERLGPELSRRRARSQGHVILTPHPGEMGRLLATSAAEVQRDRLGAVRAFAGEHAATLVLKGAGTIVADGERTGFNTSGNAGMASAGMGDVLAGMLAAFAARTDGPFTAASLAVFVHGMAADVLAARRRAPGFLAGEVADAVPDALAALGATLD